MTKRIDRTGEKYGRLTVIRFMGTGNNWSGIWECLCDCGKRLNVAHNNLYSGTTKSCGCLKMEGLIERSTKHGLTGGHGNYTRLYRTWLHMRSRCLSEKSPDYRYYGDRGVTICKEWDDYKLFHDWAMASGYTPDLTIERIDNNGNYEPSNCRWATRKEQSQNTRSVRRLTFRGKTKTLTEWADSLNLSRGALHNRLHKGWSLEDTLLIPIRNRKNKEEE